MSLFKFNSTVIMLNTGKTKSFCCMFHTFPSGISSTNVHHGSGHAHYCQLIIISSEVIVWFVRMYGKRIHELKRVDYLPFICTTIQ